MYYDHAIGVDPNFLPAKNNKANALTNFGYFQDAILLYSEIIEQNPNYLTARENLEIITSSSFNISGDSSKTNVENISNFESHVYEKIISIDFEKQKTNTFLDEFGLAFSTLGSLFNFIN